MAVTVQQGEDQIGPVHRVQDKTLPGRGKTGRHQLDSLFRWAYSRQALNIIELLEEEEELDSLFQKKGTKKGDRQIMIP